MPLGTPQPITIFPAQINIPMDHLFVGVQLQSDGTPEGNALLETVPQELIDFLQGYPERSGCDRPGLRHQPHPDLSDQPGLHPGPGATAGGVKERGERGDSLPYTR